MSGLRIASLYQGPLRSCIHALKYQGNKRLAAPLGTILAQAYRLYGMQADLMIPVPLHKTREQERGFNQAQLLAEECARRLTIPLNLQLLERTRPTQVQAHLTASERQQNVAGAFECQPEAATKQLLERKIIVIVDDVCTTGATLEACAAPLFAAGARAVWGLVLARPFN
jgi:ComF family protein